MRVGEKVVQMDVDTLEPRVGGSTTSTFLIMLKP